MLARHAEDLFWSGRYIERAEDTARMLDATYHGLLESRLSQPRKAWQDLLDVLHLSNVFLAQYEDFTASTVTRYLVLDHKNPGSIVSEVGRARDNVRAVRELVSTELWDAINSLHLDLSDSDVQEDLEHHPYELYRLVRRRCQTIQGVAVETMPRDDGWFFMRLGTMLERAEMTCRLLRVRYDGEVGQTPAQFNYWLAVLDSVSAFEAYVKAFRAEIEPSQVLDLLLLSRDFPRSVLFCLQASERYLARLGGQGTPTKPQRLLGRLRAELEFQDPGELCAGDADGSLDRIQQSVRSVAEAVDEYFFATGASPELHVFGAS